jgi:rhodanese-related sulfurtransferase
VDFADVSSEEVRARVARGEDVYLLDVREPDEVAEWAYPFGVNIPMSQLGERLEELPQDRTIVVACAAGNRSQTVAAALSERGWAAENLTGGAAAWVASEP